MSHVSKLPFFIFFIFYTVSVFVLFYFVLGPIVFLFYHVFFFPSHYREFLWRGCNSKASEGVITDS